VDQGHFGGVFEGAGEGFVLAFVLIGLTCFKKLLELVISRWKRYLHLE